jgi:GT2 family glycosyltransferase
VATLDRPQGLARCLDALIAGTLLPAEIIVVDQSQHNATQSAVEQYQVSAVPIRYIRCERRGLSASRNVSIVHAQCPAIAFTDDDCVPDQGWVAALDRAFAAAPAPDAVTGRVLPLGPKTPDTYVVSPRERNTPADFRGQAIPWLIGTGGNFALRREWFDRVGRYDERLGAGSLGRAAEDADLFYRLLRAGAHVHYEPGALVYHERQSRAQRLASRWNYGHGIGAFCGIWFQRGDRYILRVLGYWLLSLGRELIGGVYHLEWMEAYQRVLSLRGTARGLLYGLQAERAM